MKRYWWVVVLLLVVSVMSLLMQRSNEKERNPIPSTYSASPEGCKAVFLTIEELGLNASRLRRGYQWLGDHTGTLVVVDPRDIVTNKRELTKLRAWIEKGNHLVFFEGSAVTLKFWGEEDPDEEEKSAKDSKWGTRSRLAREFGLNPVRSKAAGRAELPVTLEGIEGPERVSLSKHMHWNKPGEDWTTVIGDDSKPVVVMRKLGAGRVTAIADNTMITNKYVKEQHNLMFLLAVVLAEPRPKEILFDEYHHGYVLAGSLWTYIGSSVFAWVLLQCGVGCVLFFYSSRARLAGRYRSLKSPIGRSSLEQVDSMANIFESCKASSVALEAILRRTFLKISRTLAIPLKSLEDGTFAKNSPRSTDEWKHFSRILSKCRKAVQIGEQPEKSLERAQALMEARERVLKPKSFGSAR